jgi:Na+-driven multidrug efflux pump
MASKYSVILGKSMKPVHILRSSIILILFLIVVTLLAGISRAIDDAKAAPIATPITTVIGRGTNLTPTPIPTPVPISADTTGIIALGILIVVTVLIGAVLGQKRPKKEKTL